MAGKRIAILAAAWLAVTLGVWWMANPSHGGPGLTWDEAYYYPTYIHVGTWVRTFFSHPAMALSSDGITSGWESIHELPPVVKWLGALSLSWAPTGGWGRLWAMRLIPAMAFATTLLLIHLTGKRTAGETCGVLATALYLSLPRVLGHAQIAATETVFTCVTMAAVYTAIATSGWRRTVLLALVLGLGLATKVNGVILLAVVAIWLIIGRLLDGSFRRNAGAWKFDLIGAAMLTLCPLVAFAIWPWMWRDTALRIGAYIQFIRAHSHQGLWYLGQRWNFGGPLAPVSYPFAITHLTTPIITLIVVYLGITGCLWRFIAQRRITRPASLMLGLALAPLLAASLPGAPKYDGVRLFLPMFAPLCLLAAYGFVSGVRLTKRRPRFRAWMLVLPAVVFVVQLVARPGIDYYNLAARIVSRSEPVFAFEQTYWGNAINAKVVADLNARFPDGANIKTLALQTETFPILKEWGALNRNIVIDGPAPFDAHLMQNRKGFWSSTEWLFYTNKTPLATFGDGYAVEPLVFLYDGEYPR